MQDRRSTRARAVARVCRGTIFQQRVFLHFPFLTYLRSTAVSSPVAMAALAHVKRLLEQYMQQPVWENVDWRAPLHYSSFKWEHGVTPFSHVYFLGGAVAFYVRLPVSWLLVPPQQGLCGAQRPSSRLRHPTLPRRTRG